MDQTQRSSPSRAFQLQLPRTAILDLFNLYLGVRKLLLFLIPFKAFTFFFSIFNFLYFFWQRNSRHKLDDTIPEPP